MICGLTRSGAVALALMAAVASFAAPMAARGEAESFRLGMIAREGADPGVEGLSVIRSAFSRALGMEVEVFVARDYAALIEAHLAGRLDYALYSAAAYAAASIRCECLRPVVAPVDAGGAVGFRSVLVVRPGADDGEEAPRIAVGPADSLAARLVPLASWPQAAAASAEGRLVAASSAGEAQAMFLRGEVDGFFGWVPALPDGDGDGGTPARLEVAGLGPGDYEIAWRSGLLRHGPHAVGRDMPAERVERLSRMLVRAGQDGSDLVFYLERRHGGGFATASHDDYAAAIEALKAMGEDGLAQ